ncbi:acyltransferase family protein [Microbispora sp. H10670]|uniref:acyltransferase family protein n=1 Tax=Microbispora sp. H10670 TaxID=2729108 RepID=UPI00160194A9|nr:acyltransferase family protein [Microbispora sp. H10670]
MSDTRRHPPVPGSPPGVDDDAEEAPTGVIGRITGDWPAPDGGPARRDPSAAGAPEQGPHADRTGAPLHGRHEGGFPGSRPEGDPDLPVRGRHEDGQPGDAPPRAQQGAGGAAPSGQAPYEKQPLPVRKPRRPGAARLGAPPPESAPSAPGFDYFSAGRGQSGPGRGQSGPGRRPLASGPDAPAPVAGEAPAFPAPAFGGGETEVFGAPPGPASPPPAFPAPAFGSGETDVFGTPPAPAFPASAFPTPAFGGAQTGPETGPEAGSDMSVNPFLDTPPTGTAAPSSPPDDPFGAPPFPQRTASGGRGERPFTDDDPPTAFQAPLTDFRTPPTAAQAAPAAFQAAPVPEAPAAPPWPGPEGDPGDWDPWRRAQDGGVPDPRQTGPLGRPLRAPLPAWAEAPSRSADPFADPFARRTDRQDGMEGGEPGQEPAPRARKPRDPYLDNVKFVGIAMVPIGHALVPTLAADSSRAAYLFIYVFHMPLFVIISGYLSRNFWNSNAKTNKLVDTFLVPYVIVEVGYALLRTAFGHKFSITIMDPAWLNWYLLALLFWRLSTPVWKRMRYPFVISIAVYLFAGFSELTGDFSMDRFFGLLPFFVLGLVLKPEVFDFLKQRWVRVLSVLVLLGAAGVAVFLVKNYSVKLGPIYYKNSFKDLHLVWWKGMALRTGLLVAALAMSAAVMSLVPRRQTWFTDLGTRTLYCYLLHGVPVMIAKEMGWLDVPWLYGPLGVAAIACSSFALAILLCLPVTRTAFKWLLEPRLTWLYRRPSVQAK